MLSHNRFLMNEMFPCSDDRHGPPVGHARQKKHDDEEEEDLNEANFDEVK